MDNVRAPSMSHPTTSQPAPQVQAVKPAVNVHAKDSLAPKAQSFTRYISSLIEKVWGWIRDLFNSIFHRSSPKTPTPTPAPVKNVEPVQPAPAASKEPAKVFIEGVPFPVKATPEDIDPAHAAENHRLIIKIMEKEKACSKAPFSFIQNDKHFPNVWELNKKRQDLFEEVLAVRHELHKLSNKKLIADYLVCADQLLLLIKLEGKLELEWKHFDKESIEAKISGTKKLAAAKKLNYSFENVDQFKQIYDTYFTIIKEAIATNQITEVKLHSPLFTLTSAYKCLDDELYKVYLSSK